MVREGMRGDNQQQNHQKRHVRWLVAKFIEENASNSTVPGIEQTERQKPQ
jgi:hypothetical protein